MVIDVWAHTQPSRRDLEVEVQALGAGRAEADRRLIEQAGITTAQPAALA
jgi:hypothetical protein